MQRGRIVLWRILRFRIARFIDWFWLPTRVLFGDTVSTVFPLGRLVLRWATGHPPAGLCD
jgi:hypothetical protein